MLTILSGTYLSAHFVAAILLFDTRNIRDIIPKASRRVAVVHCRGFYVAAAPIILPSCSQAAPNFLPETKEVVGSM